MDEVRLLTVSEAAEVLGVSKALLHKELKNGSLDYVEWGNEKRVPYWILKQWEQNNLKQQKTDRKAKQILIESTIFRHPGRKAK